MNILKALKKVASNKSLKVKLIEDAVIREAFTYKGTTYYMFNDPVDVSTGRGLYSMTVYEEMLMRADREYLELHVAAVEKILKNPAQTDIPAIVRLNDNLKQRLAFKIALPEHVYKLASIIFFDENESPYKYDSKYNEKKIKAWSDDPDMYAFFLRTPLKTLIPFLELPKTDTQLYLQAVEKIKKSHLQYLHTLNSKRI